MQFWPITGTLFGFDAAAPYETRLAALQSAGIALWDVLHRCRRVGSLDAKIDPKSVVANDFRRLFAAYPSIRQVCFNGSAARQLFSRLVDVDAGRRVPIAAVDQSGTRHAGRPTNCRPGGLSHRHDTGGRRCAHGRAASIWAPSASSVASSFGRPTS